MTTTPAYLSSLLRHFADLRDGSHGGESSREAKERLYRTAVSLLDPYARQALDEINENILRGTGEITASGVHRSDDGGLSAEWTLSWPAQRDAGVDPMVLRATFGAAALKGTGHHPHLRGATVGDWPLNVYTADQAAAELITMRAIVAADLHNLVFQRDFRIIPETVQGSVG